MIPDWENAASCPRRYLLIFCTSDAVCRAARYNLGSLLFLTYINNLPYTVEHSNTRNSVHDILCYRRAKDHQNEVLLQEDLDFLDA